MILSSNADIHKSILFLYSDGGPDHRLTYVSVQVSLIALFLMLDLDFLCAARTAPSHSWRNMVERVMSTLNLGLQCLGLMREKGDSDFEAEAAKCNNLVVLRDAADCVPNFRSSALYSMAHVKSLLTMLLGRWNSRGKNFPLMPLVQKLTLTPCGVSYQQSILP